MKIVVLINNLSLVLALILVLSTIFIVKEDLANVTVSGKYFGFYACIGVISSIILFSIIICGYTVKINIQDIIIFIFCLGGIFSNLYNNHPINTSFILLILILILYICTRLAISNIPYCRDIILMTLVFVGLANAIWGLMQLYGFCPSYHNYFPVTGSFFNPGPYSGYLSVIAPITLYYIIYDYPILQQRFTKISIFKYFRWTISLLSFISLLLIIPVTMSRASWLSLCGGCLCILYLLHKDKLNMNLILKKYYRSVVCFSLASICLILIVGLSIYYLKKDSADGRILIWKISSNIVFKHPLGVGIGYFSGSYGQFQATYFEQEKGTEQEEYVSGVPEYAFNQYLHICTEMGIFSFFSFLLIIYLSLKSLLKNKQSPEIGALVTFLIFAFFSYPLNCLPFCILFCILLALSVSNNNCFLLSKFASILLSITILIIVSFCLNNRLPSYKAYKYWARTKMLFNMNSYDKALVEYQKLEPIFRDQNKFLFEYAFSLSKVGKYKESNLVIQKAVMISCDPMLYNIMGKNYQSLKQYEQAEKSFRQASYIVPNRMYPHYLLFKLYYETGSMEKAKQTAEHALNKRIKVDSPAVQEMRKEIKELLETIKE